MTDDEHIGAVAIVAKKKHAIAERSKRGDVGAYLVVAAACSTDFERLAVRCTRREESRLIRPFTLQAFLFLFKLPNRYAVYRTAATSSPKFYNPLRNSFKKLDIHLF